MDDLYRFRDNHSMRFTLIEGGDLCTPRQAGVQTLLLADGKIAKLGRVESSALHALSGDVTTVDAAGCLVVPGRIDPHAHIIGTGEVAISDSRWLDPKLYDLAHIVSQTALGGQMAGKAGVTHFHTGSGKRRLALLHELLDCFDMPPSAIYPTHVNRTEALVDDAIALARRGAFVDMDTVEEDVVERLPYYLAQGGPPDRITISSDAHTPSGSTHKLYEQFVACVCEAKLPIDTVLACYTRNAATALKLTAKGNLAPDKDADVLILKQDTLEIVHLFARGRHVIRDGQYVEPSRQEQQVASGKE